MPGRHQKKTAHEWADILTTSSGMRAHAKKVADKYGQEYLDDWLKVHRDETGWARKLLKRRRFSCLDTETTSVDRVAEMTEIGIVDGHGKTLCQTLIRPNSKIKETARLTTGITEDDLKKAPLLADVYPNIRSALLAHPLLLIYNAEFDLRILNQSTFHSGLPEFKMPKIDDLMMRFSRWCGEWNSRVDDYKWMPLGGSHRAIGDCLAMIALIERMARVKCTVPKLYWKAS